METKGWDLHRVHDTKSALVLRRAAKNSEIIRGFEQSDEKQYANTSTHKVSFCRMERRSMEILRQVCVDFFFFSLSSAVSKVLPPYVYTQKIFIQM